MASSGNAGEGRSRRVDGGRRKPVGFSEEQVQVLEIVFAQCPRPSAAQRMEIKRLFPVVSSLDDPQLKFWFHNHRNLERQQEDSDVNSVREKLTITNKLLKEENATLTKKVAELQSWNAFLRQHLRDAI